MVRFAETLPVARYPRLAHLAEHGWTGYPGELADELRRARRRAAREPGVREVLDALAAALGSRPDARYLAITDEPA